MGPADRQDGRGARDPPRLSAVWAGQERNAHLDGPPLIVTRTDGATPFRLVTHIGDVGNTLVVGPIGMGKAAGCGLGPIGFRRRAGHRDGRANAQQSGNAGLP